MTAKIPHPIPYQGSKRRLADRILLSLRGKQFDTLYEPFAGSAAVTIAAAAQGQSIANRFVIGDSLLSLVGIWDQIIAAPERLATDYEAIWSGQLEEGGPAHFSRIRAEFNAHPESAKLLYLLARCVKNAPRFSQHGFNQSPDHRRKGTAPRKMRDQIQGAHALLRRRSDTFGGDAVECLSAAGPRDIVYMDPPWQGTTEGKDTRYHQGFERSRLETVLADLNERRIPWILSYDGRSGERTYGDRLASELWGSHLELAAGRSSQSTLVGRAEHTVESLYLSPLLAGVSHFAQAMSTIER